MTAAMAVMMTMTFLIPQNVRADQGERAYLSLGADLKKDEKAKVLHLLDIKENELDQYRISTVTNQDEHDYLDNYLSAKIIGSRALSSVLIEKKEKGYGIQVETENITYCSEKMYQNALSTAGLTDVDVHVAGPFNLTGTAALVGTMKAYEEMTGTKIDEKTKDTATNELFVTGELAEKIGSSDTAEELIALLKEYVSKNDIKSKEDIQEAVEDYQEKLDVSLSEEQKEELVELMKKISDLDLDVNQLKQQAQEIYDVLEDKFGEISQNNQGFFDSVKGFLNDVYHLLSSYIK